MMAMQLPQLVLLQSAVTAWHMDRNGHNDSLHCRLTSNRNITIDASGWDLDCNGCAAYSLVATVDSDDDICECNETNNTRDQETLHQIFQT
jgi:hypothetical protein